VDVAGAVAVVGLVLAWLLYRLERAATRRREIDGARAVLLGVKRGMVDGFAGEPGWGDRYFARNWTEDQARERAVHDITELMERRYSQVLVVPTTPLHALIGSSFAGDLISEETVYLANIGLWHLDVFNQLVSQQTTMLAQHLPDVFDEETSAARRYALAEAIGSQARLLHRRGVGEPWSEEGWYRRLRASVDADLERLDRLRRRKLYPSGERRLMVGDIAACAALLTTVIVLTIEAADPEAAPSQLPPVTTPTAPPGHP
jgi:hypothetical protein